MLSITGWWAMLWCSFFDFLITYVMLLWYLSAKTATNIDPRWIGETQNLINTNPCLGHKQRSVSIPLTRGTLIYKVIEIRVKISEIKIIKYKNVTIWNDNNQYLKYDSNLGLGEYQCKETTLTLIWLNL